MAKKKTQNRRDFLKVTAAGGAGLILSEGLTKSVLAKETKSRGIEINPDINNLRVVYVKDPTMLEDGTSTSFGSFSSSTSKIKSNKLKENMDKMACALANKADTDDAWGTIFQKPAGKEWSSVKVAIKPNAAAGCSNSIPHASVPIMKKIIDVLAGLGVTGSNMIIYDVSGYSGDPKILYPESAMISGIKYAKPGSGSTYSTSPWKAAIAVRDADIIVNIASCKGHSVAGKTTLTLKNHIGTMKLNCPGSINDLIRIHNSEAILGNPVSGSVPPKQQLAIIDCLWTARSGPNARPDKVPCMIVMGTLCSAVDCFTSIKVRTEVCDYHGSSTDRNNHLRFLTDYGYDKNDFEHMLANPSPDPDELGRGWVDALEWSPTLIKSKKKITSTREVEIFVNNRGQLSFSTSVALSRNEKIKSIDIHNLKGRLVRQISHTFPDTQRTQITWDGRNTNGKLMPAGTYVVTVKGTKTTQSVKISLQK